jgi:hypothetical protein
MAGSIRKIKRAKRFPSQKKGEYNTPTKHLIKISIEKFQNVKILHNKINYDKEII